MPCLTAVPYLVHSLNCDVSRSMILHADSSCMVPKALRCCGTFHAISHGRQTCGLCLTRHPLGRMTGKVLPVNTTPQSHLCTCGVSTSPCLWLLKFDMMQLSLPYRDACTVRDVCQTIVSIELPSYMMATLSYIYNRENVDCRNLPELLWSRCKTEQ